MVLKLVEWWCAIGRPSVKVSPVRVSTAKPGADPALLIGHADRAIIYRIGIAIRGIKQVEFLLGKIHPAVLVEIFGVVFTDNGLEIALPWGNHFMKRLGSRGKIIRRIIALLMIIHMYLWQPLVKQGQRGPVFLFVFAMPSRG